MSRLPWCAGCKRLLDQLPAAEASNLVAEGCLLYKARSYAKARQKFLDAISFGGHQPELTYNAALCSYQMKQHGPALKQVGPLLPSEPARAQHESALDWGPVHHALPWATALNVPCVCFSSDADEGHAHFFSAGPASNIILYGCGRLELSLPPLKCGLQQIGGAGSRDH